MNYHNTLTTTPRWKRVLRKSLAVVAAITMVLNFGVANALFVPQAAQASTPPTPPSPIDNPPLGQACGLDIGLIIDSSGSIDPTELSQMKNAFNGFVDAFLPGTPTQFAVNEFDTNVVGSTLGFTNNITNIKNRISAASSGGFTNWEAALYDMHNQYDPRAAKPDVIVFASDGNPNTVGINGNSNGGATAESDAVDAAVLRANAIKGDDIRIIALGIGNNLDVDNLVAISGPNVAPPGTIDETADVIKSDFSTLATTLAELAGELCGGKILVQKQLDTDGNGSVDVDGTNPHAALAGWEFDVNGTPSNPAAKTTTNTGALEFEVENGTYTITETGLNPGMHLANAYCKKDGQTVGSFDLQTKAVSGLTMNTDETISCTFINAVDTYKLRVKKNVDLNGDGVDIQDPNEYHVTNWTWDIQGGEQNIATSDFRVLPTGNYTINEDQKTGFHVVDLQCDNGQSFVGTESATITLDKNVTCVFTNTVDTQKISGYKFNDLNRNGVWDQPTEPALEGVGIYLTGDVTDSDTTNADGYYEFPGLLPGGYTVSEVIPNGWVNTTPATVDVTLVIGQDSRVDFGNRAKECKFVIEKDGPGTVDVNGNITYTITYHNEGDGVCTDGGVKVTDEIPEYTSYVSHDPSFGVYDGQKVVWNLGDVQPNGSGVLTLVVKAEDKGADICGNWEIENVASFWAKDKITGNVQTGSDDHTTTVYKDCEGTLIVKKHVVGGTNTASNWTMYVTGPENANFPGSESGVSDVYDAGSYVVTESATPAGYTLTYSGDCDAQGNVTVEHNKTKTCELTNTRDTATVVVHKYYDYDGDGQPDLPEGFNPQGWQWIASDGQVNFGPFDGGVTRVFETGDYTFSELKDDNFDSLWVCSINGGTYFGANGTETSSMTLNAGDQVECNFTNIQKTGDIHGYKFEDVNRDGAWANTASGTESGLAGWTIFADLNSNGQLDLGEPSDVTDNTGYYELTGLFVGTYRVMEIEQNDWDNTTGNPVENVQVTYKNSTRVDFGNAEKLTLDVEKTADPSVIEATETITYRIDWSVSGNSIATNVLLVDTILSDELVINEASISNGGVWDATARAITWDFGTQDPNASGFVTYEATVTVPIVSGTELHNIARLSADNSDPEYDEDEANVIVLSDFELEFDKEGPVTATPGEQITYTLSWEIVGTSPVDELTISDTVPANTTFVSASDNGQENAGVVTWTLNNSGNGYVPGDAGSVTMTVTLANPFPQSTSVENTAEVCGTVATLTQEEIIENCDDDDHETFVPQMTIEKTVDVGNTLGFANPGDTVEYTVVVSSVGSEELIDVVLTDTLPTGFLYADTLTPTRDWNLGDIAPGDSVTTTYDVIIGNNVAAGFYDNIAVAVAENHGDVEDDATVEVRVPTPEGETTDPELIIKKTVNVEFVNPGDTVTYTVVVENIGDGAALNVTLTDTLPNGFRFEDLSTTKTWSLGTMQPGATQTVMYNVIVSDTVTPGQYENLAIAKADNHGEVRDVAPVEVRTPAVLGDSVPTTGAGLRDLLVYLASILFIVGGALFIREGRRTFQA